MARVKLLKRVFKETGKVLGDFPATVLEDFDKTFEDSDEAQEGRKGGGGPTEIQRVPDPPINPIKDKDPPEPPEGPETDEPNKPGINPPGDNPDEPGKPTFNRKGNDLDTENPLPPPEQGDKPSEPGEPGEPSEDGENGNKPGEDGENGNKPGDKPGDEPGDEPGEGPGNGGDYKDPKDGPESNRNPYDNTNKDGPQDWDNASPSNEHISGKSIMEEALKRMKEGKSAVEKDKDSSEEELNGDGETANKNRNSSNNRNKEYEYRRTKDAVGEAVKNAQADSAGKPDSMFDDENSFDENSLLGDVGVSSLTSLWKPTVKRDWKVLLDRLLDKALGISITHDPNLINKRIEDAPPGRESETREIKKILVLLDCSGSMGSDAFIKVINQIDAMMSAKRDLKRAEFRIVGFGDNNMEYVEAREAKCKGRNFKTTIMGGFKAGGSTHILPAIQRCVKHYKNFDVILIFTDGDIYDADKCSKNPESLRFFKRNKGRVIWVLTDKACLNREVKTIDPYSVKNKQYVIFKGKGQ